MAVRVSINSGIRRNQQEGKDEEGLASLLYSFSSFVNSSPPQKKKGGGERDREEKEREDGIFNVVCILKVDKMNRIRDEDAVLAHSQLRIA